MAQIKLQDPPDTSRDLTLIGVRVSVGRTTPIDVGVSGQCAWLDIGQGGNTLTVRPSGPVTTAAADLDVLEVVLCRALEKITEARTGLYVCDVCRDHEEVQVGRDPQIVEPCPNCTGTVR